MFDYRLETFLCVCKHLNYTKASEELNITQPAVSQHIRSLEKSYQVKLFQYDKKRLSLTSEGQILFHAATTMKHDDIHLRETLLQVKTTQNEIVFGATFSVSEFILPKQIANYMRGHPHINLKLVVANTKQLIEQINHGEIDFAFIEGNFSKTEFDHLLYSKEKYIAVHGNEYIFKKEIHELEDLLDEKIILREKGSGTRDIINQFAQEKNIKVEDFHHFMEIGNINTIKYLVKQNLGISFLYETTVKEELANHELKKLTLQEFNITHDITFIWRKNSIFKDYYVSIFEAFKK
ncbi:MAG: LysR family transcriptional regulator [Erysipelotrichia bacterium]|nr:LysR family transcriptional regulator [Erysipelotrichia bacterium]NCC55512.1 LysR family transcriptional regulator [Erysipelotrichia bacterium]